MGVSIEYVTKETLTNLWRNRMMALAAVLTVAVSLSLVGAALLLRQAVNRQIGTWSNNVSLQVFLQAAVTSQERASVQSVIKQSPQITRCTYLNHKQSFEQAKRILAGEPTAIGALTAATTPPVFRCQLANPSDAPTVAAIFVGVPGVLTTTYPGKSIKVMQQVTSVIQLILFVVALVLVISSLVLILNAIRMAIFARRREIGVMKLVGATNWFIRVPFMMEGLVQGLLGAIFAVVVVLLSNIGVNYLVAHYVKVLSSSVLPLHDLLITEFLVVAVGAIIGVAGSSIAVRRFLDV